MNQAVLRTPSAANFASQSSLQHVAIIMDGNRRWAKERRLPAKDGHLEGVERVKELLQHLRHTDIGTVTLFAFASANWQRTRDEVSHLMRLCADTLKSFAPECIENGVRIEVIGRRDRLPRTLNRAINEVQARTHAGNRLLRIALDYSARESILAAARAMAPDAKLEDLDREIAGPDTPPVDLLIRTGKEQRLSDFLLWECAFAELYFSELYWPEFDAAAFDDALAWYAGRERRFGG